ncbi:MAG: RNA polymerase factor sigma-54 [Nitrospinaceae bacterium]|nr:RNA polymerase factor sigma-54 [Nitrospinaceae bacterium]NIR56588.1 RNA polymerase factor sigma-54 [Nitrospinaceae bacterium]NIS87050.1 RNA polymerase factor sigma-54 [Nitrospinaceae bacterium]NIT83894.1 RNA polymerase factor sigma-54 [Nitrospinaceae bacterium]NIU46097.1 RNA polymerase factor sigma-54 [Nitrospinaceae bacterium]
MAMEMRLNLKLSQKLVMTPMLQQAIKLLPLARMELAQLVQQEITENPVLEEIPDLEDSGPDNEKTENSLESEYPEYTQDSPAEENTNNQEIDWEHFIQNSYDQGSSLEIYPEKPSIEATYKKDPTLADHLHWQLGLSVDSELDKVIGQYIIGNIQNDGYLCAEPEEIADMAQVPEEEVLRVLKIIQGFEPSGVGARTLKECLLIQAGSLSRPDPLVITLIESYLDGLEERNYAKIASELKCPLEDIVAAVRRLREFNPKPGLTFSSEGIDYVTPDIVVIKTEEGYDVALNDEGIPRLRINPYYQSLLSQTQEGKTKEYLENKYRSALWLIKSIDQRRQTIYKVGKSIVKLQKEFLDLGLSYLKPMVLKDVAQDISMHESTVSRITSNKYIDTPQGIFELKFFFHSGIKSYMGNNLSSIRVKNMIKEIIAQEDPRNPLTDDEMVQVLMRKNAKIARRTITKYRKELHIPPASKRKKIF